MSIVLDDPQVGAGFDFALGGAASCGIATRESASADAPLPAAEPLLAAGWFGPGRASRRRRV